MSYHIVSIDSPQCSLSCRDGQLTCRQADGSERRLPLEDVASIIIKSFSAQIHSHLFLEAAKHGVALIICEDFRPTSLVLPANRSTDTLLSRALLNLDERTTKRLWAQTVDAKCRNQHALAAHLVATLAPGRETGALTQLRDTAHGRKPHKEAICAKLFWGIFGRTMGDPEFTRDRGGERGAPGLNSLLNYGYAVLLSTILQKLFAVGLDPTFGISHLPRERSTPLAYDLMEPFRPCVDWRVAQWAIRMRSADGSHATDSRLPGEQRGGRNGAAAGAAENPQSPIVNPKWEVTPAFRKWVTGFPLERVGYLDLDLEVRGVIEGVVRGFRRAVLAGDPKLYRPWTPRNSRWGG